MVEVGDDPRGSRCHGSLDEREASLVRKQHGAAPIPDPLSPVHPDRASA